MRLRRKLLFVALSAGIIACMVYFSRPQVGTVQTTPAQEQLKHLAQVNRARLQSSVKRIEQTLGTSLPGTVTKILASFKGLHEQRDQFNVEELRDEIFAELARNPEVVRAIQQALSDHDQAITWFGDSHATARVWGIQFLGYLARIDRNEEPLQQAIRGIADRLKSAEQESYKGQLLDFEDLLQELGHSQKELAEPETFINLLSDELGIDESDVGRNDLVQAFGTGIALGLRGTMAWDDINTLLIRKFPRTFGSG